MKLSFEKKIVLGFIINLIVVIASAWIFIYRISKERDTTIDAQLNWIEISLFFLSIILLIIVYFVIRTQLRAKNDSQKLLHENQQLLQSIIDNTSNPIFIKKLNGEYVLINKQFGNLFKIKNEHIIGKTDQDFLPEEIAATYRDSDLEVIKKLKELKTEETIELKDGLHTFIAVKFPLYDSSGRVYAIGGISTDITERKKLEETFVASDKFFRLSTEMMIIADTEKFLKVNPATIAILGYTEEELLNQPFINFVYKQDVGQTEEEVSKLKKGISTIQFKNRYVCKDGTLKWLLWSTSTDKSTGLLYAVASDVTQLVENENSLKIADNFFNIALEIMAISSTEKFIKINPMMIKTLGYTEAELLNTPFLNYVADEDKEDTQREIEQLKNSSSSIELKNRWLCKDGTIKWLSWTATPDLSTGLFYAVARDITTLVELENEQQNAINELYENEEKLRLIVENIGEGVIVANANKIVVMANHMANNLFGIAEDTAISSNLNDHFELYLPDEKTIFPAQNLPMEKAFNGEITDDVDIVLWDPAKREKKRVLISGRPLIDQDDNVVAAVITIKDISKYKKMEEDLKEAATKYRKLIGFKKNNPKSENDADSNGDGSSLNK
jgi:PAS domain S-box-containing protein